MTQQQQQQQHQQQHQQQQQQQQQQSTRTMAGETFYRRVSSSSASSASSSSSASLSSLSLSKTVQTLVLFVVSTCCLRSEFLPSVKMVHGRALGTFGSSHHPPLNLLIDQHGTIQRLEKNSNTTNPFLAISAEALDRERHERRQRMRERRERARRILAQSPPPPPEQLERVDAQYLRRHLSWFSSTDGGTSNSLNNLADPSQSYDKWSQAYRMLGGMIDCDHDKDQGSNHGGKNGNNGQNKEGACSRWMLWAAVGSDFIRLKHDTGAGNANNPCKKHSTLPVSSDSFSLALSRTHQWPTSVWKFVQCIDRILVDTHPRGPSWCRADDNRVCWWDCRQSTHRIHCLDNWG